MSKSDGSNQLGNDEQEDSQHQAMELVQLASAPADLSMDDSDGDQVHALPDLQFSTSSQNAMPTLNFKLLLALASLMRSSRRYCSPQQRQVKHQPSPQQQQQQQQNLSLVHKKMWMTYWLHKDTSSQAQASLTGLLKCHREVPLMHQPCHSHPTTAPDMNRLILAP